MNSKQLIDIKDLIGKTIEGVAHDYGRSVVLRLSDDNYVHFRVDEGFYPGDIDFTLTDKPDEGLLKEAGIMSEEEYKEWHKNRFKPLKKS